ncbi:hypothetical protein BHE74_00024789 [Ensete ventricosum]|nr:hypothetical protein GW17_00054625 [Ensete ventricosum]RWW67742.1 hypothetical protein BHE74_00024789 [Ensete ventricosum]
MARPLAGAATHDQAGYSDSRLQPRPPGRPQGVANPAASRAAPARATAGEQGQLSAGKGSRRLRRGSDGGVVRVREEG